jgi:signal transduction histidine kinase
VIDDLGLVPALRSHTAQLARSTRVNLGFESQDVAPRWPIAIETSAFRIAQEALTNSLRHSKASRIIVSASIDDRCLEVRIHDDGVGFDPVAARSLRRGRSLGLVSMAERARLAGGQLKITSASTRGTTVSVQFRRRRRGIAHTTQ